MTTKSSITKIILLFLALLIAPSPGNAQQVPEKKMSFFDKISKTFQDMKNFVTQSRPVDPPTYLEISKDDRDAIQEQQRIAKENQRELEQRMRDIRLQMKQFERDQQLQKTLNKASQPQYQDTNAKGIMNDQRRATEQLQRDNAAAQHDMQRQINDNTRRLRSLKRQSDNYYPFGK